ncbi:MAG TPA: SMP-30/gluconolactonase/LRE family protein [Novosphingobium sp.]|nr:SMP-30/gluconolactonase/LRE family protein [Novosphingobium sp.]
MTECLSHVIPASATGVLAEGLTFPECPRWHGRALYCVDGPHILRIRPDGGGHAIFATLPTPMVLGLCFEADGSLLAVAAKDRIVWRIAADGVAAPWADLSGVTAHPLNEIIALPDGAGWLVGGMGFDPARGETPAATRLIHLRPDLSAAMVGPEVVFPNGMGWIAPDRLLVAESFAARLSVVAYCGQGQLGARQTLCDVAGEGGHPDGLWAMGDGTAWYADAWLGTLARIDAAGRRLAVLRLPYPHALACCPDATGTRLFVAASAMMPGPDRDFAGKGAILAIDLTAL